MAEPALQIVEETALEHHIKTMMEAEVASLLETVTQKAVKKGRPPSIKLWKTFCPELSLEAPSMRLYR